MGGQTVRRVERDEAGRVDAHRAAAARRRPSSAAASTRRAARASGETISFSTGRSITNGFGYDAEGRSPVAHPRAARELDDYGYDAIRSISTSIDGSRRRPHGGRRSRRTASPLSAALRRRHERRLPLRLEPPSRRHRRHRARARRRERSSTTITWPDGTTTQFSRNAEPVPGRRDRAGRRHAVHRSRRRSAARHRDPEQQDSLVFERDMLGAIHTRDAQPAQHRHRVRPGARVRPPRPPPSAPCRVSYDPQGHLQIGDLSVGSRARLCAERVGRAHGGARPRASPASPSRRPA